MLKLQLKYGWDSEKELGMTRFRYKEANFEVTYDFHQNFSLKYSQTVFEQFGWHSYVALTSLCLNLTSS